jgi:pre-mRNA-splicing factor ATP-dependent RNA helicase DHX15/PRP43
MSKRSPSDGERPSKRSKADGGISDPAQNPYLAHMYEEPQSEWNGNGGILSTFKRHQTTAKDAQKAEDGPENPLNGNQLSKNYFKILQTRRNLPVHAQRYVHCLIVKFGSIG